MGKSGLWQWVTAVAMLCGSVAGVCAATPVVGSVHVEKLRCEDLVDPLGIDATTPRLSWVLLANRPGARDLRQTAYRVLVASSPEVLKRDRGDLWDSGKVASSQSNQLRYAGKPLVSQQSVWWKVQVWDQDGRASAWSTMASWSMGLLQPDDWKGQWIGLKGGDGPSEELSGARWIADRRAGPGTRWFRCLFQISQKDPVSYALFAAAGSGEITAFVNGQKIGGSFPRGYAAQDITEGLHTGWNSMAIEVKPDTFSAAMIAGITLDRADGRIDHIQSDPQWKASDTEESGWQGPEFDDANWRPVQAVSALPLPVVGGERTRLAARMLRKDFVLKAVPSAAHVYISGLGYFELYLNGRKVGKDVLAPGLTDYDRRVLYVTYDVTRYLHAGKNAVGILLGNGRFYAPRMFVPTKTRSFGYPEARMQLEIDSASGHSTVVTNTTWQATAEGPIRANNDYDGEEYDARMEKPGWSSPGYTDQGWMAAQQMPAPEGELRAQMNPPIQVDQQLRPVTIIKLRPDAYIFDMGQNMMGWSRLRVHGPAGARVTLRYAETLRPDGGLYTDNLRSARQTDLYILKGGGEETWEPRFTEHGYRYVEVIGFPGVPTLDSITGEVVHDALAEHTDFDTSNATINGIYKAIVWSDRGNYRSIPTDCDQRDERQGWLGDRSAESFGETYFFDVEQFYAKWLNDIADSQKKNGQVNDVAPAYWPIYSEQATWPSTFFFVADMLHQQYGDDTGIQQHYPEMRRWIEHTRTLMRDDLLPVDTYGDWCVPPLTLDALRDIDPREKTAPEVLGSTYFYYLLRLMSQYAAIAGQAQDQQEYDALAERLRAAFNRKYFHPETNLYGDGSQTSSVLALAVGIAPHDRRSAIAKALAADIEHRTHGHVGVGIIGQQWLMKTLTNAGYGDVAYQILTQTTYPSWGYMLAHNATTIWELWNGNVAGPAMNSGNHLMLLGDLQSWLYEDLAGIRTDPQEPGFRHILIQPRVLGDLTYVRASHDSPYGLIGVDWRRNGDAFTLHVTVPPNTTATVFMPADDRGRVRENGRIPESESGVRFVGETAHAFEYEVGSGEYVFASHLPASFTASQGETAVASKVQATDGGEAK